MVVFLQTLCVSRGLIRWNGPIYTTSYGDKVEKQLWMNVCPENRGGDLL
jgi:hypothetical protein